MILLFVEDLLFISKVQQTAQLIGVAVQPADPACGLETIVAEAPRALILDLNHRSFPALDFIRTLKAHPSTKAIPIVGFVSHVQLDVITAAREAGCDLVLARSAFTQQLPQLLRKLARSDADTRRR
jgi:CheY-like chemotaxis protein